MKEKVQINNKTNSKCTVSFIDGPPYGQTHTQMNVLYCNRRTACVWKKGGGAFGTAANTETRLPNQFLTMAKEVFCDQTIPMASPIELQDVSLMPYATAWM